MLDETMSKIVNTENGDQYRKKKQKIKWSESSQELKKEFSKFPSDKSCAKRSLSFS